MSFQIFQKKPTLKDFQYIIDKLRNKLSGWKTRFLNIAGRSILAKTTLNNILNHTIQYITLLGQIHKKIHQIQRNCIWETTDSKRKIHLISWETIIKPKDEGDWESKKRTLRTTIY